LSVSRGWAVHLSAAAGRLSAAGVEAPRREARLLLCEVLGLDMSGAILAEEQAPRLGELDRFEVLLRRRERGEPISRIRGWREFYGRLFEISPDVLDPRPETEGLVDLAVRRLPKGGRFADLGCGSGCILASVLCERPDADGVGVDISPGALAVARRNIARLVPEGRAALLNGDFAECLSGGMGFDMIVSNPPYIPSWEIGGLEAGVREFDPALALDGGPDGLCAYRAILLLAQQALRPDGCLLLELGAGQAEAVAGLAKAAGFQWTDLHKDLAGIGRILEARLTFSGADGPGDVNSLG